MSYFKQSPKINLMNLMFIIPIFISLILTFYEIYIFDYVLIFYFFYFDIQIFKQLRKQFYVKRVINSKIEIFVFLLLLIILVSLLFSALYSGKLLIPGSMGVMELNKNEDSISYWTWLIEIIYFIFSIIFLYIIYRKKIHKIVFGR
jgi:hypothetical protein